MAQKKIIHSVNFVNAFNMVRDPTKALRYIEVPCAFRRESISGLRHLADAYKIRNKN
ncbi:hypothetical protein BN2475_190028 [Paraburkholderia ribeironis]|uniref:Uncharacterized protein n=1 Tax=Paraburkholderia ribeironis TaxID=1247936 RepID=A0A1N7RVA4_9BURK|nr:hypothetical protein BN2475_190028 [Paraburkholderia ribeironis]